LLRRGGELATDFPEIVIRDHQSLADGLRRVQNFLNISNECLEEIAGLTRGHADKLLGPSRSKAIGKLVLGLLLDSLGVELVVRRVNPEVLKRMERLWQQRDTKQIHVTRALIDRCRPYVLAELGLAEPQSMNGTGYKG
jgi:hypothetical protein